MFVSSGTLEAVSLTRSAATVTTRPRCCDLSVPYTGTITPQTKSAVTSALRRAFIELPYGTRLKGVSVSTCDQVLTVTATASDFAIKQWLDSGEFMAAVDGAVRQARVAVAR